MSSTSRKSKWESDESDPESQHAVTKKHKSAKKAKARPQSARDSSPQPTVEPQEQPRPKLIDETISAPISPVRRVVPPAPKPVAVSLHTCRHVDNYEKLNRIEEGAYGIVFRARDRKSGDIVALKKFKLDKEKNGFPVTSLREIRTLMLAKHPNIVNIREIVVGDKFDQ